MNMYDVLESQFYDALAREAKTVNTYVDGSLSSVTCLFRMNRDKNATTNRLTIYYPINSPIVQGKILQYNNDSYIVLNQETSENHVYYKSDLEMLNAVINVVTSDGYELVINSHAYDWKSVNLINSSMLTTIDGTIELVTEDNAQSRKLSINDTFIALGATWQIFSIYYKTGICYVFVKRIANSSTTPVYTLEISASDSYWVDDIASISVTAKKDNTTIVNPTIVWESSNTDIATVSPNGTLNCVSVGNFTLSATWVEHGITVNKEITVDEETPPVLYTASITYSGNPMLYIGSGSKTFTAVFRDGDNQIVSLTPTWSLSLTASQQGNVDITDQTGNIIKLKMNTNAPSSLIGTTFGLNLSDSGNLCTTSLQVSISSLG